MDIFSSALGNLAGSAPDSSQMDQLTTYGRLSSAKAASRWFAAEPLSGRSNFVARVATRDSTHIGCAALWLLHAHGNVRILPADHWGTPPVCQLPWEPLRRTAMLSLLPLAVPSCF